MTRTGMNDADPRHDSYASMRFLDETLKQVVKENPGTELIEMSDLTCPDWLQTKQCPDTKPGGGFYRDDDGVHYGPDGAIPAGQWLVDQVSRLPVRRT
ncbi:MAG TPA: hypothetical protein VNC41_03475, partial [Acidimicrobiia bacterium]|nr:hypothetical protein [Acidimicrobiia bacterium]